MQWAILSTANIGRIALIPAIRASTNGHLVAIASRDPGRAREFARTHSIPTAHMSYEALLDDPDVDAVYIPLPNSMHREWVIRAANAGKHILCEKPLALDEAECHEMAAAAASNGVRLMEAFMYRFHPRTEQIIERVRNGVLGELRAIRSTFTFRLTRTDNIRLDPALGGGALMDVGCYCVNVSRTLAGAEPVEVQAFSVPTDSGVDGQLAGALRFESGLFARFDCALTIERRESFEVAGTHGAFVVDNAFLPGTTDASWRELRGRAGSSVHTVTGADQYRLMVEHFADSVLHDRPLRYPLEEAALNMRTIEALYRSARNAGRPEPVAPPA